jgi:hypothetical protein
VTLNERGNDDNEKMKNGFSFLQTSKTV